MAQMHVPILVDWDDIKDHMAKSDIVEVVRCKDCKYWYTFQTTDDYNSCEQDALLRHKDFFCAAAERKEDETD